jgi:hypothetical protein
MNLKKRKMRLKRAILMKEIRNLSALSEVDMEIAWVMIDKRINTHQETMITMITSSNQKDRTEEQKKKKEKALVDMSLTIYNKGDQLNQKKKPHTNSA